MTSEFQKIAIVGQPGDARVAGPTPTLVEHLTKLGIAVSAPRDLLPELGVVRVDEDELANHVDLIISVGGDGTILRAARIAGNTGVPLLGINCGRLGFLADVTLDEMLSSVDHILGGDYSTESRLRLEATLESGGYDKTSAVAFNDVVLQRRAAGRMVDFETRVGDHYVNTHAGDGLIVSTPTGSTAYALSCGGPILEPRLDALVVVPICPHTLSDRPIVIPADETVSVSLLQRDGTQAAITVDGRAFGEMSPGDKLTISAAGSRIKLIHPPGYDFYGILRSKLFWGRDSRVRDTGK
jgi:NAD+ kinase